MPRSKNASYSPNASPLALGSEPTRKSAGMAPAGSTGGEVTSIPKLEAQTVDGTQQATLTAPDGWGFRVRAWVWEDDDYLVSPVVSDGGERMARCSAQTARCVLINTP